GAGQARVSPPGATGRGRRADHGNVERAVRPATGRAGGHAARAGAADPLEAGRVGTPLPTPAARGRGSTVRRRDAPARGLRPAHGQLTTNRLLAVCRCATTLCAAPLWRRRSYGRENH